MVSVHHGLLAFFKKRLEHSFADWIIFDHKAALASLFLCVTKWQTVGDFFDSKSPPGRVLSTSLPACVLAALDISLEVQLPGALL